MRNDRHLAIKLRKKGVSYNKISKELGIPKSTMSYWFRDKSWSQKIKKELTEKAQRLAKKQMRAMARANKRRWRVWRKQHREKAKEEFPILKSNPLFITGLMLYWGEGDSKLENGSVRLSNTDPEMIRIFSRFLQRVCRVLREKIRVYMILYPDLNEKICKKFWSKVSGIPESQFIKTQFIQGKHPTRRSANGICIVHVGSRGLKEKIFTWIKLYQRELKRV
jgi:AcrR family transcriptional regulator